jgi:hypothetical protein
MADIGAVWKRSAAVERVVVTGRLSSLVLTAGSAQVGVGYLPLPRNIIGRLIAEWVVDSAAAFRSAFLTRTPRSGPTQRHYHPRREAFIEDAAMSREMHRL